MKFEVTFLIRCENDMFFLQYNMKINDGTDCFYLAKKFAYENHHSIEVHFPPCTLHLNLGKSMIVSTLPSTLRCDI